MFECLFKASYKYIYTFEIYYINIYIFEIYIMLLRKFHIGKQ